MSEIVLQLKGFAVSYDGVEIFGPLDLSVGQGERVAVQGENGSGKSTLLRTLAGLVWPRAVIQGRARILDCRPQDTVASRAQHGLMLIRQLPTAYSELTVLEQVLVAAMPPYRLHRMFPGRNRDERSRLKDLAQDALGEFELTAMANHPVRNLSMGQRRRLAFASVRVRWWRRNVRLLLVDEPMSGLDGPGRRILDRLLNDLTSSGCAVLLAEHVAESGGSLGQRRIVLSTPGAQG